MDDAWKHLDFWRSILHAVVGEPPLKSYGVKSWNVSNSLGKGSNVKQIQDGNKDTYGVAL